MKSGVANEGGRVLLTQLVAKSRRAVLVHVAKEPHHVNDVFRLRDTRCMGLEEIRVVTFVLLHCSTRESVPEQKEF